MSHSIRDIAAALGIVLGHGGGGQQDDCRQANGAEELLHSRILSQLFPARGILRLCIVAFSLKQNDEPVKYPSKMILGVVNVTSVI